MRNFLLTFLFLGTAFLGCNAFVLQPQHGMKVSRWFPATPLFQAADDTTTGTEHDLALEKATKAMTAFTNKYLKNTDTKLCQDPSVAAVVIKGLAEHKVTLGSPLCPCRFYEDKEAEAKDGYWNCPCVPMRERHECHCMLFLTDDNEFSGDAQQISYEEVVNLNKGVSG